eukprot:TRINITY_DN8701_c0_g1_i1.p1 TRINITY_DN8701_c0_g1~~TRINITY_DN8701_c0_g1_i1.p1  ORF type:complete len:177 (+),score=24.44 TRINITY_DN8701_c0_g1_i1:68-598(+)
MDLCEVIKKLLGQHDGARMLVSVCGVPGSGKTTTAGYLEREINKVKGDGFCIALPMDGYHISKEGLRKMKDPEEAVRRRGAHWTFDAEALYDKLVEVKSSKCDVSFPSFDHSIGDPDPTGITIPSSAQIIVVEGNYLLFKEIERWERVSSQFDWSIFLQCDQSIATERLIARHMVC